MAVSLSLLLGSAHVAVFRENKEPWASIRSAHGPGGPRELASYVDPENGQAPPKRSAGMPARIVFVTRPAPFTEFAWIGELYARAGRSSTIRSVDQQMHGPPIAQPSQQ